MRTCVIGDGGWGTALALLLHENGHRIKVWGPFRENIDATIEFHENKAFLPGIEIPHDIDWTAEAAEAVTGAEMVVMAVPTKFYAGVASSFGPHIPKAAQVVSVSKGFDPATLQRMSELASRLFPRSSIAVLSGPSHAEEVARGIPTAVVVASDDARQAGALQEAFGNKRFRVYTSTDVAGVELGGALKNVIAVAVGISDGMGFGDNTRAALITRGLAEITRLGVALGARAETFAGLSGMGDLVVTCTSSHSRNRSVGERLGKGETIDEILGGMKQVAEGVTNCKVARKIAREAGIEAPVTEEVYNIIYKNKDPRTAVDSLLSRDFKPE